MKIDDLHILHIDTGRTWRGGQAQVLNLCRGLRQAGIPLSLATPPDSVLARKAAESGIDILPVAMRGEFDPAAALKIRGILKSRPINLVHVHDAHAHSLAWLAMMGLGDIPLVVSRRVDFEISRNLFSRLKYLSPKVRYFAISNGVREVLGKGGVAPERIRVVPSGVDASRFKTVPREAMRNELGIPMDAPVVGTIGSLADHKGHRYLIEAAFGVIEQYPAAQFVIVGEGELRRDLEEKIRVAGLHKVFHLPGYREDIETFLSSFDIFALPSHLEGLCTSLIDAMLWNLPVVGTRTGGIPDLILDGETGLLVEPKNPSALADGIVRLLGDAGLAERLAKAGAEHARSGFTAEAMVRKSIEGYLDIVNGK